MITKGSKIQLIKPMGIFDNIGEVCEVVNVTEDGVISFRFGGYHLGCMSYDEFQKYFIVYEEENNMKDHNINKKRIWSDWVYDTFLYLRLNGEKYFVPVKYRTNGKIIDLRTDAEYNPEIKAIKVKAFCHKNDEFDLDKGLNIADARLQIELMKNELEDIIDRMD